MLVTRARVFVKSQYVRIFFTYTDGGQEDGPGTHDLLQTIYLPLFLFVLKWASATSPSGVLTGSEKRIWRCWTSSDELCSSGLSANWQCITMPPREDAHAESILPAATSYLYQTSTGPKASTATEPITTSRHPSWVITVLALHFYTDRQNLGIKILRGKFTSP